MKKIYVIGIGPGGLEHMTERARKAIEESDVICGYTPYIEYIKPLIEGKEVFTSGMTGEIDRCKKCIELAEAGKVASIISTGDAGVYGMASPMLELLEGKEIEVEIVPGISSVLSAAAELGAPLTHDFAVISLSDLLTDYDLIMKRLSLAAEGDFVIAIYNPRSKSRKDHLEEGVKEIRKFRSGGTPVGIVKNSGREGREISITDLDHIDYESVDMLTILIVGNSTTKLVEGRIITPRGYW
ncbi:MAG: precorrin-3B C(17)-methyltransferase [Tissierellia bacterium]|nr:precorrin-3B C(17)-methyltransferase [Tissierellia bacterium]